MALLDLRRRVRAQRASLRHGVHHQRIAIHAVPGDLQGDDHASRSVYVHRHLSYGPVNSHQHVLLSLCAGLG